MDAYYTPDGIAARILRVVVGTPDSVADFTAGSGVLLKAAARAWPTAKIIATDISRTAVSGLQRSQPEWHVGRCDFLSSRSRAKCAALRDRLGQIAVALLNPPFSGRGGSCVQLDDSESELACSKALAVVVSAFPYVRPGGQVVAILPASTLRSEKDRRAWSFLRRHATVRVQARLAPYAFPSCAAETVIASFTKRGAGTDHALHMRPRHSRSSPGTRLIRGVFQMHTPATPGDSVGVVHTTELKHRAVLPPSRRASPKWRQVRGPALLLPRVGMPNADKVALYLNPSPVVLSDCVIAVTCSSPAEAAMLQATLLRNWPRLRSIYAGTCAKYTTVRRLSGLLSRLGVDLSEVALEPRTLRRIG